MEEEEKVEVIDIEESERVDSALKLSVLQEILPDASYEYIKQKSMEYVWRNADFEDFVQFLLESKDYPKKNEELQQIKLEEPFLEEIEEFSVEHFTEIFPDPKKYFSESQLGLTYKEHSTYYLKKRFRYVAAKDIFRVLREKNYNLTLANMELEKVIPSRVTKRNKQEFQKPKINNQNFLNEAAYLDHEREIMDFIKVKELQAIEALQKAKLSGQLLECGCCFNDEVFFEQMIPCAEGHLFCKDCVKKSAEILIGDGKIDFPCLSACGAMFDNKYLKDTLSTNAYEKIMKRRQELEVKAAGIAGLVSCPFCEYAEIPPEGDRIFKCKSCKKESCRLCGKLSHIPLRCDEAVESEKTAARTFIESKMSEALIRTCYKCGKNFIKEDGCNKMTCTCGAKMCYLCREPVKDYNHFTDKKETTKNKCPLYTNNQELHIDAVRQAGEQAQTEVQTINPQIAMEYDPFVGLQTPQRTRHPRARHNNPNIRGNRYINGRLVHVLLPRMMLRRHLAPHVRLMQNAYRPRGLHRTPPR